MLLILTNLGFSGGEAAVVVQAPRPSIPPEYQRAGLSARFFETVAKRTGNATTDSFGTVKQGASVAFALASTVSVDSADATDLATAIALVNELKADVNQLVSDNNSLKTVINNLRSSLRNAGIIDN